MRVGLESSTQEVLLDGQLGSYRGVVEYFAYGSNMDRDQMKRRCPEAEFLGPAVLPGCSFQINRRGVATVIPSTGEVHGILWETLRRGCWNHRLLAKAEFVGAGKTKHGYAMYMDGIPYVVKEEISRIVGGVYAVDQGTLEGLDSLEGHPSWYERGEVDVVLEDGRQMAAWL